MTFEIARSFSGSAVQLLVDAGFEAGGRENYSHHHGGTKSGGSWLYEIWDVPIFRVGTRFGHFSICSEEIVEYDLLKRARRQEERRSRTFHLERSEFRSEVEKVLTPALSR